MKDCRVKFVSKNARNFVRRQKPGLQILLFFVAKKTAKQACHSYFAKKLYQSGFHLHFWISLLSTSQRYTQLCHQFYFKTTVPVNNLKSCITSTTIQNGLTGVLLKREKTLQPISCLRYSYLNDHVAIATILVAS